jgi:hypothetical protein
VPEAPVVLGRLDYRLGREAQHPLGRALPQGQVVLPEFGLGLDQRHRVGKQLLRQRHEVVGEALPNRHHPAAFGAILAQPQLCHAPGFLGNATHRGHALGGV